MFNDCLQHVRRMRLVGALTLGTLLTLSTAAFAQSSTTATLRGTVQDSSGGVLPGATVTLTNSGTKSAATTVTDDRGSYLFVTFPGTYSLKVELSGFTLRDGVLDRRRPKDRVRVDKARRKVNRRGDSEPVQNRVGERPIRPIAVIESHAGRRAVETGAAQLGEAFVERQAAIVTSQILHLRDELPLGDQKPMMRRVVVDA